MEKSCENCKNYIKKPGKRENICHRPTIEKDPATGKLIYDKFRPVAERKNNDHRHCGSQGRFFEPKFTAKDFENLKNWGKNE